MKPGEPEFDKALRAAERLGYSYAVVGQQLQEQHETWVKADAVLKELEEQVTYARNSRDRAKRDVETTESIMQALIIERRGRR